jgi:hypothetical protein
VRLPTIAGCKFALAIVIRQLQKGNGLSFASNVGQIDISAESTRRAKHSGFVRELVDRSDDNPSVFALAIGTRFSPSVLPDVGAALTLGSHDAAILHGLTSDFIFARTRGQRCASQAQSRHKVAFPQSPVASEIAVFRVSYCFAPARR